MLKLFLIIAYTANLILSTESAAPLTCTENERVSNCPDGENPKIYCSQLEERAICKYPVSCRKGCVCTDGYLRNDKFVCVPINECPRSTCGENEIFSYCVDRGCENNYCSQLDQHNTLSEILFCMRGCICKDGYLRNDKKACVPISEIQYTKTGKYDETTKSIKKREALTVTENMKNIDTTTTPSEHANYIAMITPFQATPTCTENEIVSHCVNGGCGKKHCSQLEEYTMCDDPLYCMKGCICKDGYLRNDQGVCVPINECPRPTCGENEIFSYCMDRGCENNYCSQLHQNNEEILHCRRGCICKDGYMLNDEEACVPISESLKF